MTLVRLLIISSLVIVTVVPVKADEVCAGLRLILARAPSFSGLGAGSVPGNWRALRGRVSLQGFEDCMITPPEGGGAAAVGPEYQCASASSDEAATRAAAEALIAAVAAYLPSVYKQSVMAASQSRGAGYRNESVAFVRNPGGLTVKVNLIHTYEGFATKMMDVKVPDVWSVWLIVESSPR